MPSASIARTSSACSSRSSRWTRSACLLHFSQSGPPSGPPQSDPTLASLSQMGVSPLPSRPFPRQPASAEPVSQAASLVLSCFSDRNPCSYEEVVNCFNTVHDYSNALKFGTKYIYRTMPRMLTIWLDCGAKKEILRLKKSAESGHALTLCRSSSPLTQLLLLPALPGRSGTSFRKASRSRSTPCPSTKSSPLSGHMSAKS